MEYPVIDPIGDDYIVSWPDTRMTFYKIKEHSEGYSAILTVEARAMPGIGTGLLFEGRMQLLGPNSKRDAAKACAERATEVDWVSRINLACHEVINHKELGSPIIELGQKVLAEQPEYIFEPYIRHGENSLIFGDGGSGKSILVLALGQSIASRVQYVSTHTIKQSKTLYLDYEDHEDNQEYRLHKLKASVIADDPANILYKRADTSLPAMAHQLARQIGEQQIKGLIIDSAALACGLDPETADSANAYFRAIDSLKVDWSLTIAHQPKDKRNSNYPFGSVFWQNNPRNIWHLKRDLQESMGSIHIGLFNTKSNNGQLSAPRGYEIVFNENNILIQGELIKNIPDFESSRSARQKILDALQEAYEDDLPGLSRDQIADKTDIPYDQVKARVKELRDKNIVSELNNLITLVKTN